ncbi:hypothetical protein HPT25_24435 [Bacillus sp. BRMEA1]|uniref:hypothetical protein n=1 Tax=Neobacillus endophyticus TaxID=2738405 RepID=UPI001566172A|nr:hypothetical protein [Neobacillus endophyticus]NRD80474.1 hypothetical protein [Neobacillus endophyticus]
MRRIDFFREIKSSLIDTVISVYDPFIKSDIEKVEEVANLILGITWVPVLKENAPYTNLDMEFINGMPIIFFGNETNRMAMEGFCPECLHIFTVTSLYSIVKCLDCGKEYNFKTQLGDLKFKSMPLKRINKTYYVGFTHS